MLLKKSLRIIFKKNYGFLKNSFSVLLQFFRTFLKRIRQRNIDTKWTEYNVFEESLDKNFRSSLVGKKKKFFKVNKKFDDDMKLNDIATGFWLRCILEKKYERVIEIGTLGGKRVRTLKNICKDVDFYGLDVQDIFKSQFELDGVKFSQNKLEFFKNNGKKTLILSRGCLSYYTPQNLNLFFKRLYDEKMDIAFLEPICIGEKSSTIRFEPDKSFYHPYELILENIGFSLSKDIFKDKFTFMLSMMENWYINIAFSKKI